MPDRRPVSPVIDLLTVAAVWDGHLGAELRDLGLTTRKYALLAHIGATPGISFSELARRSRITVQTAHTAVRSLVVDGFAVDETSHAGAASDLRVTAKGADALVAAQACLERLDAALAADSAALVHALAGLREQTREGSGPEGH